MKQKAMLSQPMAGKTEDEIIQTRARAVQALEEMEEIHETTDL